jgi:Golgi phosphoprotein 3 (GPP34)
MPCLHGCRAYRVAVAILAEDLYLLADDAATGRPLVPAAHLDLGLGGALLLDLALRYRIACGGARVAVVTQRPTGEMLLDSAIERMTRTETAHDPGYWVRHLARGARRAVQKQLVDVGVLRHDDHRLLRIVPVHRTPEVDGRLHHQLVDHLYDAVVLDHTPTVETAALAMLALAVGLEERLFPRSDREAIRRRMAEVAAGCRDGAWVASAVTTAVNAVDAAVGAVPTSPALP